MRPNGKCPKLDYDPCGYRKAAFNLDRHVSWTGAETCSYSSMFGACIAALSFPRSFPMGLRTSSGRLRCSQLYAAPHRVSDMTLRRRERRMPPKLFARTLRFDRAIRLLRRGKISRWAELADAFAYADQAHLTRDFDAFAGSPPASFIRRKLLDDAGFVD